MPKQVPAAIPVRPNEEMMKAEAKKVADAAAAKTKTTTTETKKEDTKKVETKPAATTTEPAPGPGACVKADICDTEVAGVKVYCGA